MRVVMLLSQCSGGDSLRITPIIALAFICTRRLPIPYLIIGKKFHNNCGINFLYRRNTSISCRLKNTVSACNHIKFSYYSEIGTLCACDHGDRMQPGMDSYRAGEIKIPPNGVRI